MSKILPLRHAVRLAFLCALGMGGASAQTAAPLPAGAVAASSQAEQAFARGAPLPSWVRHSGAIPAGAQGAALGLRLSELQLHVAAEPAYYVHRALVANEASALANLGQFDIEFQPGYQRVQLHKLAVLRGGASIDKLPSAEIRFLQRERNLEQGMYDGSVTAQIVSTDLRVGDTLDIEYTVSGQNPVFGQHVMEAASWDANSPTALRRVLVDLPADKYLDYRLLGNGAGPKPRESSQQAAGRRLLRLEAEALPPVLGESYVPFDAHAYRWLQFSDFRDWAEVNAWALELFSAPVAAGVLDGPLRAARAARTPEEAVARVLDFVQNEIRYLSVSLGENSHRPFPPAQVLERRYGDCKDKSLLMVSMLRALGIDAHPVLLASYATRGLDQMLPTPALFDHAIVRVTLAGKEYYLDPTRRGQYGALARMGQIHGGRQVLVVKAGTAALSTVPLPDANTLHDRRSERIEVTAMDQPVELVERLELSGASAENARVYVARLSKEELRKTFEGGLVKRYPEAQLVGEPRVQDERQRNSFVLEARHRIPNFFTPAEDGESWGMRYQPSNLTELFAAPGNAHRSFPLAVPFYPNTQEYDLLVNLPPAFAMTPESAARQIDDEAFKLARKLELGPRSVHVNLVLSGTADRVQPARMGQYLKHLQQYEEMLGGGLRVFKAHMRSPAAAAAAAASAAADAAPRPSDQERLRQQVDSSTRVIADADLRGRDPSAALCERALAHAWLGQQPEALKDVARAVQLQPQSSTALRCRADVFYVLGRFRDSESAYQRLLARGAGQAEVLLGHALASLYLGQAEAAQGDFRALMAASEDEGERLRATIWYRLAGGKDKLPPPPAGADGDMAWLQQAHALFLGEAEPEQMVRLAGRQQTAGIDGRLVEAYFYAGRYYLGKGQELKARAYFERAVKKQVLDSTYHVAARHELARMKN